MKCFTKLIILLTLSDMVSGECTNCHRCVDDTCRDRVNDICHCKYGCEPGYYGGKCLNDCPEQCITCGREYGVSSHPTYGICYECKDGYHNGSSTSCLCPINCQQCTSTTQCTVCYPGWHGTMCQSSCPPNCKDQTCRKSDGMCTDGCITESFVGDDCNECGSGLYGNNCSLICSTNCKDQMCRKADGYCTNGCRDGRYGTKCNLQCSAFCNESKCHQTNGTCYECISGKYNLHCETDCKSDTCLNNKCNRSSGLCTIGCSGNFILGTDYLCQTCKAGKYGSTCENDCLSRNCKNNACNRSTGTCMDKCNGNYVLGSDKLCETCIAGKYGQDCNIDCPSGKCLNNRCDKNNGKCTNGCITQYYVGEYCDNCTIGLYGSNCNMSCPSNCKDYVCTRNDGRCVRGCKSESFIGNKCDACKTGFHGEHCNFECPINCYLSRCSKQTGECHTCKGNFTGSKCDDCTNGYYSNDCNLQCPSTQCYNHKCNRSTGNCDQCQTGLYGLLCDKECSDGCKDGNCRILDGKCENGCRSNYTGDKCCIQYGFCEVCDNTTYCSQCVAGYFGETCKRQCPSNCLGSCKTNNGHCLLCKRGYYETKCELNCPRNCNAVAFMDICDFRDGTCLEGCVNGYYNQMCDRNCSTNCLEGACDQATGKCNDCVAGFHGETCQYECSKNCMNETCSQENAECFHGCTNGFHGKTCQQALRDEDKEGNNIVGPVVGSVAGFVVIVIGVMAFLMFRKWKGNKDKNPSNALSSINDNLRTAATDRRDDNVYQNDRLNRMVDPVEIDIEDNEDQLADEIDVDAEYANAPLSTTKIRIMDLYTFVTQTEYEHFKTEFGRLPRSALHSYECARKSENRALNRFRGIYPYDHSRVKLKHDPTFFINACYIDGYNRDKAYIASVGPTAAITNGYISFWTMVWYENVDKIVILTKLQEETGMKCERYWPFDGESKVYGDITVSHQEINVYAEYTFTTLLLEKTNQQRYITHIHYTAWPDKTIPDNVVSLVEFYNRVKSIKSNSGGPTIVHCSAGIGRTGTFIALDKLTEQGRSEQSVNVYECVMGLREQRMNMVQTHEQYEYLHRCITYTLTFGSDPVTTDYVQSKLSTLDDRMYTKQFKMFDHDVERKSLDELQAIEANKQFKDKNRPGADIPGNRDRPRLYLNRSFNGPDYINAVYIDSFKKTNRYIVAQTPLPETLSDFLCLLYQSNCSCIVDMNGPGLHNKTNIGVYQPEENQSFDVDSYTISSSNSETSSSFIKSILKLENSSKQNPGEITITHYQYTGWKQNTDVPDSVNNFVQFVNSAQVSTDSLNEESPMIIHCLNGYERSGLFCTTSIMLEKLECEQQISIGNTIRQVRLRRNKAIPNEAQYKFCIQCAAAFTNMFNTYSNFAM
ncbi:Eukaryotic-type carbonic anhydrase [Mactra antiquata]